MTDARSPGDPMLLANQSAASLAAELAVFFLAMVLVDVFVQMLLDASVAALGMEDVRPAQVVAMLGRGLVWIGLVAAFVGRRRLSAASIGWSTSNGLADGLLGLPCLGAAFAAFYLMFLLIMLIAPAQVEAMQNNATNIQLMLPRMHPVALVAMQFVVATYEEIVFRGYLLPRLRRVLGNSWIAASVLSTTLFAIPHIATQETVAALPIFGLGITFCVFTIWRRSLLPAIIGHALFNSWNLLFIYYRGPEWA